MDNLWLVVERAITKDVMFHRVEEMIWCALRRKDGRRWDVANKRP